jgi:hypothetical protein
MILVWTACEGVKAVKRSPTSVEGFYMKDEKKLMQLLSGKRSWFSKTEILIVKTSVQVQENMSPFQAANIDDS